MIQKFSSMPCLGAPLASNYACTVACSEVEECCLVMVKRLLQDKDLAGLPEFLTHTDCNIRRGARNLVEQLRRK